MIGMKRTIGRSALVALIFWFALAAGSVWASNQGGHAVPAEATHAVDSHAATDAGHAVAEVVDPRVVTLEEYSHFADFALLHCDHELQIRMLVHSLRIPAPVPAVISADRHDGKRLHLGQGGC